MTTITARIPFPYRTLLVMVLVLLCNPSSRACAQLITKLKPETVTSFENYVKEAENRMQQRLDGREPFLWIDEEPRSRRRVRQGEIVIQEFKNAGAKVPSGLIHEWLGAMFIAEGSLNNVVVLMQDFSRHASIYPEVIESELLERDDDIFRSRLKLVKRKVLTVVLKTEHEAKFNQLSSQRYYVSSYSTKIAQVKSAGSSAETELPVGEDSGFLWRLNAYWRLEQAPDGVFVELVTLSLTRDVPSGMGWLIKPFIRNIPRESLTSTLEATRAAALK